MAQKKADKIRATPNELRRISSARYEELHRLCVDKTVMETV